MGGSLKKAREHFNSALAISSGKTSTPFLSLATTVAVKEQNIGEFKDLLDRALKIDPEAVPENRLVNTLNRRKAQWLLEHVDDYFVESGEADLDQEEN
jgi:predicted anti-sigma-YlaC factor YlaD